MSYSYRIYSGKEFCALGVGFFSEAEAIQEAREKFDSPMGRGYYTHADIVCCGKVLQTVNNDAIIQPSTTQPEPNK